MSKQPELRKRSGECPICGKQVRIDLLGEHADECAARCFPDQPSPAAVRKRKHSKQQAAKQRRDGVKRTQYGQGSARGPERTAESSPRGGEEDIWDEEALFQVESVRIDEFEFRCQNFEAATQRGGSRKGAADSSHGLAAGHQQTAPSHRGKQPAAKLARTERSAGPGSSGASTSAAAAEAAAGGGGAGERGAAEPSRSEEAFLDAVRAAFDDEPHKYRQFVEAMTRFQSGAIDTVDVMEGVGGLLRAHPSLLDAFNGFLPDGYKVVLLADELSRYRPCYVGDEPLLHADALALARPFVERLCERYEGRPEVLLRIHAVLGELGPARAAAAAHPGAPPEPPPEGAPFMASDLAASAAGGGGAAPAIGVLYRGLDALLSSEPDLARELAEFFPASCRMQGGRVLTVVPDGVRRAEGG